MFSLDSIITAAGWSTARVMVTAILVSIAFMLAFAKPIGDFVERHPTVKVLALSFLIMIGLVLIADGFGQHIPKGYIYAAMAFSVFVELINLWIRKRADRAVAPVRLHEKYMPIRTGRSSAEWRASCGRPSLNGRNGPFDATVNEIDSHVRSRHAQPLDPHLGLVHTWTSLVCTLFLLMLCLTACR